MTNESRGDFLTREQQITDIGVSLMEVFMAGNQRQIVPRGNERENNNNSVCTW